VECAFPNLSFARPVDFTYAGDGTNRLFAIEQEGRVRVFPNQEATRDARIFLDLSKQVRRVDNEEGLLGIAFHPRYREYGEFFVFYSVTPRGSIDLPVPRPKDQMPLLATRKTDDVALVVLRKWIAELKDH
jgi:hypothetical protein